MCSNVLYTDKLKVLVHSNIGFSNIHKVFDTALGTPTQDAEGAALAPFCRPRIGSKPKWSAICICAPSKEAHDMLAQLQACHVSIDAAAIGEEVLIHVHECSDWAKFHDLSLDGRHRCWGCDGPIFDTIYFADRRSIGAQRWAFFLGRRHVSVRHIYVRRVSAPVS